MFFFPNLSTSTLTFQLSKFIYCHSSNSIYKCAGPGLSANLGTHATSPVDDSEGWMEPEKEERTESPLSFCVLTDFTEPPQLPMNGMNGL